MVENQHQKSHKRVLFIHTPIAKWTANAALFTVRDQMCKLCAATTPSMPSSDTFTLLYLISLGVPSKKFTDITSKLEQGEGISSSKAISLNLTSNLSHHPL